MQRRGTLIDWFCVAVCLAVFGMLFYQGVVRTWSETGVPSWYQSYLKWEKQIGLPDWFPL